MKVLCIIIINVKYFRYNADPNEIKEEESLNLTSAIWFAWGVLLNSGQITLNLFPTLFSLASSSKFCYPVERKNDNNEML